ncbi:axin-related protein-like [Protopterus annectens]|uniref:axin-related protein-like n=1 Tax=Protopterus annectens TaxID=7888 RepID=UPI001CFB892B|nr:axin-related protein-like [Protopterus annectens]
MSSTGVMLCLPNTGSVFRENTPRPPIPGEENKAAKMVRQTKQSPKMEPVTRRKDSDLGEPEGCAAVDSRITRWSRSIHALLDDQDGAKLFRAFLERDTMADTVDFWFACNGFRQMDPSSSKTARVARAIYRWYIQNSEAVSVRLKPATRAYIKDCLKKQQIDSVMFDQAQLEIQCVMEAEKYPTFLKSDICEEYEHMEGESPNHLHSYSPVPDCSDGSSHLPPLVEEEEEEFSGSPCGIRRVSGKGELCRATANREWKVKGSVRIHPRKGELPQNYFVPATSANDSEISSDALTDDTMSMADSSAESIPPYRGKKQQQREIHRSVSANGHITLPFVPRTQCPPPGMIPLKPAEFAAKLIAALEKVKRQREAEDELEERLRRLKEDEDRGGWEPAVNSHQQQLLPQHDLPPAHASTNVDDDPQSILDNHLSRVLKTPAVRSPGSQSPDGQRKVKGHGQISLNPLPKVLNALSCSCGERSRCPGCLELQETGLKPSAYHSSSTLGSRSGRKGDMSVQHKAKEESYGALSVPSVSEVERSHNILQWVMESARMSKKHYKDPLSSPDVVKKVSHRSLNQPAHPFLQDPSMPPMAAPDTLVQLEEARRRLLEEKATKMQKPRCLQSTTPKDRSRGHEGALPVSGNRTQEEHKPKKTDSDGCLAIAYYFCGEPIPYKIRTKEQKLTLGEFKQLLSKKGSYKYYFKKTSHDLDCPAVYQEVSEDSDELPLYEDKVICKVERAC